jgi:metallo-beta-lactamase class B VIM
MTRSPNFWVCRRTFRHGLKNDFRSSLFEHRAKLLLLLILGCSVLSSSNLLAADDASSDPTPVSSWQVTPDLEISELQTDIWVHTSWHTFPSGLRFPSNGLILREGDSVLLIDTAWGETATVDLLDWIESELKLPVSAAIATHTHDDRMGGAPVLAERGIPLFSHPLSIPMAISKGWPEPRSIGSLEPGGAVKFGPVEVFYPGAAHTVDNIMIWLPEPRLLAGGCAVKSADATTMGNVAEADLDEWPVSMRRTAEHYPDAGQILPGHGDIGGPELLMHTTQLLEAME